MADNETRVLRPRIEIPIDIDEQDGAFVATCPLVPGISSTESTSREAASALASEAEGEIAEAVLGGALVPAPVTEPEPTAGANTANDSVRYANSALSDEMVCAVEALFRRHHQPFPVHIRRELVGVVRTALT